MNTIKAYEIIANTELTKKAAAVLLNLTMHSNKEDKCFPALKTIARECKMSVRSVQRGLDELLEIGLITKKHNFRANGSQTSNIYTIVAAVEERAAAAKENAMLKMRDLRKRMEQAKAKKNQTALHFPTAENAEDEKDCLQSHSKTGILSSLAHFAQKLHPFLSKTKINDVNAC